MAKTVKGRTKKSGKRVVRKKPGLPPGSVIFDGVQKVESVEIDCIRYNVDKVEEFPIASPLEIDKAIVDGSITWVDIVGLHDSKLIEAIGKELDLDVLVTEDIASTGQRPKVEFFEDYAYVVVKMISMSPENRLSVEQVSIILGRNFVVTFQEREGDLFGPIRDRIRSGMGRIRRSGADYLSYAILDIIVDHYFVVLGNFSDVLDDLEDEIIDDPSPEKQTHLRDLRKELILLRRAVWPVRELVASLQRSEVEYIDTEIRPYFRDVHDHAVQILDVVESLRDVVGGLMDLYLSGLSNKMNEIMKVLTLFGSIFLPLSFMVGMYGMNFDHMPELHYRYGYPVLILVMVLVVCGLLLYFKRKKWL